ncbi:MAG: cysteine--tRNA ligase [Myxococcales bacterium]|nr:cysteine--tRNA ligase [Myxococcales bacterium]
MSEGLPTIEIYDTFSASKGPLKPLNPGTVQMYVCGMTVYDYCHIGHARTFMIFDMVRRYLAHRGYNVKYVRNHTDVDDKIIARANEIGEDPVALAARFIEAFDQDMAALGCIKPDLTPKVTEEIDSIVEMIQELIEKGHAYDVGGEVLYEVSSFEPYGKLSKRVLEDLRAGERVEVDERKRNPGDFVLWKAAKPGEPAWESPWGRGRPGWHIECSAMATKYLAPTFDIHGGGRDLVFPHHENEIAQSEGATGCKFANHWMHVGPLTVDGEKMGKSLGNFWTLRDALEKYHPQVLRYFNMTAHYRKSVGYSIEILDEARARVVYFYKTIDRLERLIAMSPEIDLNARLQFGDDVKALVADAMEAMDDDFNTPKLLAQAAELGKLANELMPKKDKAIADPSLLRSLDNVRAALLEVFGSIGLFTGDPQTCLTEIRDLVVRQRGLDANEIEQLISDRAEARTQKDWSKADELRDKLDSLGVVLMDSAEGTRWEIA